MQNSIQYNISIISFFDILGFTDIINKYRSPGQVIDILKTLEYQAKPNKKLASMYGLKLSNFSDTVVRTTNILSNLNRKHQVRILFHELMDLIRIQCKLIEGNVFIRGCVTLDEIYHDESYIFGPGLNRAYNLEKNTAVYPRIIVDPSIFNLFEERQFFCSTHHDWKTEKHKIKNIIRESSDGVWFLDYLKTVVTEPNKDYEYGKYLKQHKDMIIKHSQKLKDLDHTSVKYGWLAHYHNEVIKELSKKTLKLINADIKDFYINKEQVKTIYKF